MFDKIIGYESIKNELKRFNDVMTNKEYYSNLGVSVPKGIIFYGEPGTGKSLCAYELIAASKRNPYVVRCTTNNLAELIDEVISEAKENQPAIILFDDLDKFSDNTFDVIYNVVQAGIDRVATDDIFVIATANALYGFPDSLLRPGRFDRKIKFVVPIGKDADDIILHYLSNKKLDPDIDMNGVIGLLNGRSCASIESVINMAGLYAGYDRSPYIKFDHILNAVMAVLYDKDNNMEQSTDKSMIEKIATAYHEAGHAVMNELLNPGKTTIVSIKANNIFDGAFTSFEFDTASNYKMVINDILVSFAGSAAVQIHLGYQCDIGANSDFTDAIGYLHRLISDAGYFGIQKLNLSNIARISEFRMKDTEILVYEEANKLYTEAKEKLIKNWNFVDAVATELLHKETLVQSDIVEIKNSLGITE